MLFPIRPCGMAIWCCLMVLLATNASSAGHDYFLRVEGNDSADGTSLASAWRSIGRVNQARLKPGDAVWFEGGAQFIGNLQLTSEDAGDSNAPVVIGSRGPGRAVILAGAGTGIHVESAGHVVLENLEVRGAGLTNNQGYGILCDNLTTNGARLRDLSISGIEVSGFGIHGILISGREAGFEKVRVRDCVLRDNLRGGMEIAGRLPYDSWVYAHADVVVSGCEAHGNTGDPNFARNHSGSGIVLYQVDGGSIRRCTAWNNGFMGDNRAGGGVGLWVCASRRVVIEECESFANKTRGMDGGGFDIDGGCEECVLQYNYSHDNDGPGLMVYTYPYAQYRDRGNVVRFNISENDSRRSRTYAGLWVRADGRTMSGLQIHNNTVVMGPWCDQVALVHAEGVEAGVRNNIFASTGQAVPMKVTEPGRGLRFEGNLYWRQGRPSVARWGRMDFGSLVEWRRETGQELSEGRPAGVYADPQLSPHPPGLEPFQRIGLGRLAAFRLQAGSPALSGGIDLEKACQIHCGPRDFLGTPVAPGNRLAGAIAVPQK